MRFWYGFFWIPAAMVLFLAGCNSTEQLLQPNVQQSSQSAGTTTSGPGNPAPRTGTFRIRLAPIVGTTVEAAEPLSRRIATSAADKGLEFVKRGETNETHVMKGYFSVFGEGDNTIIIYVWDLLDTDGNRLHRIQGQATVAGTGGSALWGSVPPHTMEQIADDTISNLSSWTGRGTS